MYIHKFICIFIYILLTKLQHTITYTDTQTQIRNTHPQHTHIHTCKKQHRPFYRKGNLTSTLFKRINFKMDIDDHRIFNEYYSLYILKIDFKLKKSISSSITMISILVEEDRKYQ